MQKVVVGLSTLVTGLAIAACSTTPASFISTGSLPKVSETVTKPTAFAKPVKAAKATRMYVWSGFKEKDCSPVAADMKVATAPTKGTITFKPNEPITIQHSASGKCVGQRMQGTAVYYTPNADQIGPDTFTVSATTATGQAVTRSFNVTIE
ncbi:MAG: hypothetical protein JXQ99_22130 [Hyphomicrobiaceae bacterium]